MGVQSVFRKTAEKTDTLNSTVNRLREYARLRTSGTPCSAIWTELRIAIGHTAGPEQKAKLKSAPQIESRHKIHCAWRNFAARHGITHLRLTPGYLDGCSDLDPRWGKLADVSTTEKNSPRGSGT